MASSSTLSYRNPSINALRSISSSTSAAPASPHTPQRITSFNSAFSSPGGLRAEDEYLIFSFGARHIDAGLVGESAPRCSYAFEPGQARRVGDYREWLDDYEPPSPAGKSTAQWGRDYELWQMDLREENLGLVEDKLERAVRTIYSKHLLLDPRTKAVALVLPSVMPTAYIEKLLSIFCRSLQVQKVTLLPQPVLSVVGAGLRSGLVVDVGWHETIITAVYELRQVDQRRSIRAMKLATLHLARMLCRHPKDTFTGDLEEPTAMGNEDEHLPLDFQDAEEGLLRIVWCQSMEDIAESQRGPRPGPGGRQISGSWPVETATEAQIASGSTTDTPKKLDEIPFASFCLPIESSLFANGRPASDLDENELTLPTLMHSALIGLPPDVRGTCVSRIMFTGGGSSLPGLRARLMAELSTLINIHGFDPVRGRAAERHRRQLATSSQSRHNFAREHASKTTYAPNSAGLPAGETPPPIPAGLVMPETNKIDKRLAEDASHRDAKSVQGILRAAETLGPWSGGSLALGLRIKAVVDVDREAFLSHGLASAKAEKDIVAAKGKAGYGAREPGWTLGMWG